MVNVKRLGIGGGVMFVFGIVLWCGFPGLIRSQIKKVSEHVLTFYFRCRIKYFKLARR